MLGKSCHLPGSHFRRLPNPCATPWTPGLDLAACLAAFGRIIQLRLGPGDAQHRLTGELLGIFQNGRLDGLTLTHGQTLGQKISSYSAAATHLANIRTGRITYRDAEDQQQETERAVLDYNNWLLDLLDALHWTIARIDERLRDPVLIDDYEIREVIVAHLASIWDHRRDLNTLLATATADNTKETILVNFYFDHIFGAATQGLPDDVRSNDGHEAPAANDDDEATLSPRGVENRSAIWLGLMFRMWAWLFLHDFHPEDKMIERSEFKDNRLPVYIG
jgi:hypothetical protein